MRIKPDTNVGPTATRKSEIQSESGNDISAEIAGMTRKNIVTKPLSLWVAVSATW